MSKRFGPFVPPLTFTDKLLILFGMEFRVALIVDGDQVSIKFGRKVPFQEGIYKTFTLDQ